MDMVDRISDLQDELLCHILSFLKTKQVVVTSVLSRRWKFLWTYVNVLDFSNFSFNLPSESVQTKMQFEQFVHRVLQLHRAPVIKRMELCCRVSRCNEYDIVSWIQTAVCRKVEKLELLGDFEWPNCLFYSQTLVELSLFNGGMTNMSIPTAPFLPNLKKLCLRYLRLTSDFLKSFISGCSNLEYLDLKLLEDSMEECCISSATLKRLKLYRAEPYDDLSIVLNTPSLEYLFLEISVMTDLELLVESSLPSLHEAHIYICTYNDSDSEHSLNYLECFSNVTVLSLQYTGWISLLPLDLHAHFHNMTKLVIDAPKYDLNLLRTFMEKSNNLKVIVSKMFWFYQTGESGAIWEEPQVVPKCLLSSLRTMCIKNYGKEEEVDLMIKYVLANAKVLENMEIHCSAEFKNDDEYKLRRLQKISKFLKASEICELTILNKD